MFGGGICSIDSSDLLLEKLFVLNNSVLEYGGGIEVLYGSNVTI